MSEEELSKEKTVPRTESGEEHTTPPMPAAPVQWSMPDPVFQQTSGYLPQGYLKQIEDAAAVSKEGDVLDIPAIPPPAPQDIPEQPAAEAIAAEQILETDDTPTADTTPPPAVFAAPEVSGTEPPPAALIEPQPHLSDQFTSDELLPAPAAPAAAKSSGLRTALIVLGLLGMLALLAVFLAFVYLYFIAVPGEVNNF